MDEGYVQLNQQDQIATITFFHPQSNSLPGKLLEALAQKITEVGDDSSINAVILKSGGERTFCAGASFDELMGITSLAEGKKFFMGFARVINACRKTPKPIIGRVQGKAVGGGVGLASSVDYCFATQYAAVRLSELAVGIGPFVVGPAVERKVGLSAMSQMALKPGQWYSAAWAKSSGLYAEVFDSTAEMDKQVEEFAGRLAGYNPEALKAMKEAFWQGTEDWDELLAQRAEISGRLVLSDFTRDAIREFKKE